MAYLDGALDNLQRELSARFASLRDSRTGTPVYALEHGLDSERLQIVRDAVGAAVRRTGVSAWWRERSLPLLVVATEVGYGYRGTGTDFWPQLCSALAAELSYTEHVRLSELFEAAHIVYRLKRPTDTPWNRLFHHIAWPISNAIAPLEIHRGLARALQRVFQSSPASLEGADLAGALRVAARAVGSARLQEWVADQGLSVALSRRLMRLDHEEVVSPEAIERIWRDLSTDTVARRAIRLAMREQRSPLRGSRSDAAVSTQGVLHLLSAGSGDPQLALSATFPDVTDAQRRWVRGLRLPPWAGTEVIGLEAFLLGHPQFVAFSALPHAGDGFLPGLGELLGDIVLRDRLLGAAPDMTLPLVFVGTTEVARQVRERSLSRHEAAWLVTDDIGDAPTGVTVVGRIGPAVCLHVPEPARAADWLGGRGIMVRDLGRVEPVGAVVVGETPRGPVTGHGLPALFRLIGGGSANVGSGTGDPGVTIGPQTPFLLARTGTGEQELSVHIDGRSSVLAWTAGAADSDREDPLEIALDPSNPSLEMLRRGELAVHIRTSLRLPPKSLELSVVAGERVLATSRAFGVQLPALLTAGDGMVDDLVRALDQADVPRGGDVWLVVDIENLRRDWWPLSREARRVTWERHDRDWRPRLGEQVLDLGIIDADRPLDAMRAAIADEAEQVRLLLPVASDGPVDEGGFVVGPRRLNVAVNPALPGHPGRAWRATNGIAVQPVCLNYLRWSWAEARNPVLEVGRRRVAARLEATTVVQFCGDAWARIEVRHGQPAPDPWIALAETAMARGLAAGSDFPDVGGWKNAALVRHLAQRAAAMVPDLWPAGAVTEGVAEQLDLAVGEAWEDLFEEILRREGRFVLEDIDPGSAAADWAEAVALALERVRFSELVPFLLPRSRALALSLPDYQDLSLEEIGDMLVRDHADLSARGQPRWLSDDDIRRALLFWARPTALSTDPDWLGAMQRLLSDRQTARAVRYAALRYAASRGRRI